MIAHASSNLVIEKGMQLFKWPKTKCRRQLAQDEDQLDVLSDVEDLDEEPLEITIQPDHVVIVDSTAHERARASADEPPGKSDEEYWSEPINQVEIMRYAKPTRWTYSFGVLISLNFCVGSSISLIDHQYLQPCVITDALPCPNAFVYMNEPEQDGIPDSASKSMGQEILDRFDPSMIPPEIAFQSPQSRVAIEKEITDLLAPPGKIHPSMIEIDLRDQRYVRLPKAFSKITAKIKSVDLYKGRLCTRGDLAPLTNVAFVSSSTSNRCCVRMVITLAVNLACDIKALDISQASPQAENLNERDRIAIIPPSDDSTAVERTLTANNMRSPNITCRDTWIFTNQTALWRQRRPDAMVHSVLAKSSRPRISPIKTDVCVIAKYDQTETQMLLGSIAAHVGDIFFDGETDFLRRTEQVLGTFRSGVTECLAPGKPITFLGIRIGRLRDHSVVVSQSHYIAEMPK